MVSEERQHLHVNTSLTLLLSYPDQPLLVKSRKMEFQSVASGPTPSPTPQPNGTRAGSAPLAVDSTMREEDDPLASLTPVERKLKEEKFIKVRLGC